MNDCDPVLICPLQGNKETNDRVSASEGIGLSLGPNTEMNLTLGKSLCLSQLVHLPDGVDVSWAPHPLRATVRIR